MLGTNVSPSGSIPAAVATTSEQRLRLRCCASGRQGALTATAPLERAGNCIDREDRASRSNATAHKGSLLQALFYTRRRVLLVGGSGRMIRASGASWRWRTRRAELGPRAFPNGDHAPPCAFPPSPPHRTRATDCASRYTIYMAPPIPSECDHCHKAPAEPLLCGRCRGFAFCVSHRVL